MSQPYPQQQSYQFTPVVPAEQGDRDFVPLNRCKGILLIVRPLEYRKEGFKTKHQPDGTDVVFADVASLDPILEFTDPRYGTNAPGFPAGQQFRNQAILQGFLKGAFKRYLGATLLGTIYFGVAEKGFPPLMWQDLSGDPNCVTRAQHFMATHPEFLIPVEAAVQQVTPDTSGQQYGQQPYQQPQQSQGYGGYQGNPNAPQQGTQTVMYTQHDPYPPQQTGPQPYQQPYQNAIPVSAQPVSPAQPVSTLDQLRHATATAMNHQGQSQPTDPPF